MMNYIEAPLSVIVYIIMLFLVAFVFLPWSIIDRLKEKGFK